MGNGRYENISSYKSEILMRILSNERLVKLLAYDTSTIEDKPPIEDSSELVYNRVFPYRFLPDTAESAKSFISMSFTYGQPSFNQYFDAKTITIYIQCHKSLFVTDEGYLRPDEILVELDKAIMSNDEDMKKTTVMYGSGKLKNDGIMEYWFNNEFGGYSVRYRVSD